MLGCGGCTDLLMVPWTAESRKFSLHSQMLMQSLLTTPPVPGCSLTVLASSPPSTQSYDNNLASFACPRNQTSSIELILPRQLSSSAETVPKLIIWGLNFPVSTERRNAISAGNILVRHYIPTCSFDTELTVNGPYDRGGEWMSDRDQAGWK